MDMNERKTCPERSRRGGFTLIELLVVIAIISVLASFLLPSLQSAKEQANMAYCTNNLHQFKSAIQMYENDYETPPYWLSNLYPEHIGMRKSFVCRSDPFKGTEGCKPPWTLPGEDEGTDQEFEECDDFGGSEAQSADSSAYALMNHDLPANSYLYEFNPAKCSWWSGGTYSWDGANYDTSSLGSNPSWRAVKQFELRIVGIHTPIVSCFWHVKQSGTSAKKVLRLGVHSRHIYRSSASRDDWKHQR